MSSAKWHRFKDVVASVLERDRQEWPAALLAQCGDDVDLFLEASALLAVSRSAEDFIEAPAWQVLGWPSFPPLEKVNRRSRET